MILLILIALHSAPSDSNCSLVYDFSKSFMEARQKGIELPVVIDLIEGDDGLGGLIEPLKSLAIDAYSHPQYRNSKNKDRAIKEFSNDWYVACLKHTNQSR